MLFLKVRELWLLEEALWCLKRGIGDGSLWGNGIGRFEG